MDIDTKIGAISTLIDVTYQGRQWQGTGFFFNEMGPDNSGAKPGVQRWVPMKNVWLVTNKHIAVEKGDGEAEYLPDTLTFHLRRKGADEHEGLFWHAIVLTKEQLRERIKLCPVPGVDVVLIRVTDVISESLLRYKGNDPGPIHHTDGGQFIGWSGVTEADMPGENKIDVHVGADVLVVGYPDGFYDEHNRFPIVKSGIVASRWGGWFDGEPYFLIDAKLFPGSSGSLVISKPTKFVVTEQGPFYSKDPQFAFLGIYSADPYTEQTPIELDDLTIIRKKTYDVGIVWYAGVVPLIANEGITWDEYESVEEE